MTKPVATSIIGDMSEDYSTSRHCIPYYPFIDMEVDKYEETHTLAPATTEPDATDGFPSRIKGFDWSKDLLLELEEILRRFSEKGMTIEVKNTKVNDIIA